MPTLAETWEARGQEQGVLQGQRDMLHQLLAEKFGPLPETVTARIDQADQAALAAWAKQVLKARSLKAMFPDA